MITTKVFTSGNSQAVRIPKEFNISGSTVQIKKIGSALVLVSEEEKPWQNLVSSLGEFTEDFMSDEISKPDAQVRETL